jgi:Predicted hydrolase of the alpha/beta superfamily
MSSTPHLLPPLVAPPATRIVPSFAGTAIHYDRYEATSRTAVVVIPGFWRDRKHASMVRLASHLSDRGASAVVLDPRGHGDSEGTYGFNLHEHHDVAAVVADLLETAPIDRVALVGFSYGASIAISTAARHPELPFSSLLLVSPVADFSMIAPRINPLTIHRHIAFSQALRRPRFDWRVRKSNKIRPLDDIASVHLPLCLIHVKNDWLISHRHSVALYEAANEPKELHLIDIPGNYHADRIFSAASESIEPLFEDFLERHAR